MSRIILIGENDTISIFEEATQTETLIRQIQNGLWKPPAFGFPGPYCAIQKGNTLVVTTAPKKAAAQKQLPFSAKEMSTLQGLASGLTDDQIAVSTGIHTRTVRLYVARLKKRLGALTREHLVAKAGGMGLYDLSLIAGENNSSEISAE